MTDLSERLYHLGERPPRPAPSIATVRIAARRMRRWRIARRAATGMLVVLLAVVGVVATRGSHGEPSVRTASRLPVTGRSGRAAVTVEPGKELSDGDVVHVSGRGFPPHTQLSMAMCRRGATLETALSSCDTSTVSTKAVTDSDGTFATTYRVHAGTAACRVGDVCALGVAPSSLREGPVVTVPLEFADRAPAGSTPVLGPASVRLSTAGLLRDRQRVTVTGRGFAPGSRVALSLCEAGTTLAAGGACGGLGTPDLAVESDGTFERAVTLYRQLFTGTGFFDCGAPNQSCVVQIVRIAEASTVDTPVTFDPKEPAPPLPKLTIEASTPTASGARLTVLGTGFPSEESVALGQCARGVGGRVDRASCATPTEAFTTSDTEGTFRITAPYLRSYDALSAGRIQCGTSTADCVLAYFPSEGDSIPIASVPLTFSR